MFKTAKTSLTTSLVTGKLKEENKHLYVAVQGELLELLEIQLTGKKRMTTRDFLNGFRNIGDAKLK